jgi:hypothetical protein
MARLHRHFGFLAGVRARYALALDGRRRGLPRDERVPQFLRAMLGDDQMDCRIVAHVSRLDVVQGRGERVIPTVPQPHQQTLAGRLAIADHPLDPPRRLRNPLLDITDGCESIVDRELEKRGPVTRDKIGIAGGLCLCPIERRLPFGAFLGLEPPLAIDLDYSAFSLQLGEQVGDLGPDRRRVAKAIRAF